MRLQRECRTRAKRGVQREREIFGGFFVRLWKGSIPEEQHLLRKGRCCAKRDVSRVEKYGLMFGGDGHVMSMLRVTEDDLICKSLSVQ